MLNDGDSDPSNTSFTPAYLPILGISEKVSGAVVVNADGTYDIPYEITVSNMGSDNLSGVDIENILNGAYPGFGAYTPTGASHLRTIQNCYMPIITGSGALSAGAGFNGSSNVNLASEA